MVLSTNKCLEMQIDIKDKMQYKLCTLRSISSQREALYLYRVKFQVYQFSIKLFAKRRLNIFTEQTILLKGSLPMIQVSLNLKTLARQKADIFFFIFYFIIITKKEEIKLAINLEKVQANHELVINMKLKCSIIVQLNPFLVINIVG